MNQRTEICLAVEKMLHNLQHSHATVAHIAARGAYMARIEGRMERLDDLERRLAQYPGGLSISMLARIYRVNRSTIHRDMSALERRGTGIMKAGRHWKLDHRRSLYGAKFTPEELVSLYVAARLLSRFSDE